MPGCFVHLCTVKTVIWQICSNRPATKVPQGARLSAGRGVQSLFGQCPNRGDAKFGGASLRGRCKIKMKYFGQTPLSTSKCIYFFAEKTFHLFHFYFASSPYHSSNSLNHVNPPMPLFSVTRRSRSDSGY